MVNVIFTPKGRTQLLYAVLGLTIISITGCASPNSADETAGIPFEADANSTVEESKKSDSTNSAPAALPVVADCSTFGSWGSYDIRTDEIFLNSLPPCDMNGLGDVLRISEWETWDTSSATAPASYGMNSCQPDCSSGNFEFRDVRVVLDRADNGFFGQLRIVFQDGTPDYVLNIRPRLERDCNELDPQSPEFGARCAEGANTTTTGVP
jgi:hypothetical protein